MSAEKDRRLFAGIDWASKTHAICVVDEHGEIRVRFEIANTGKTFTGLVKRLTKLDVEGAAIERCDGPLVEALLDAGLRVGVITPRQVKGLRSRYTGSGAESDASDAYLLADVLRTDGHRLTPLTQDSDATQVLRSLSRTRKQFSRLDSDVTIAFLRRIAYCGRKPVTELYARITDAPPAGLTAEEADGHAVCVHALLAEIGDVRARFPD